MTQCSSSRETASANLTRLFSIFHYALPFVSYSYFKCTFLLLNLINRLLGIQSSPFPLFFKWHFNLILHWYSLAYTGTVDRICFSKSTGDEYLSFYSSGTLWSSYSQHWCLLRIIHFNSPSSDQSC